MTETKQALDAVVALVGKATPGAWERSKGRFDVIATAASNAGPDYYHVADTCGHDYERRINNADAIAAAVTFLRTHGRELAHIPADWQPTPEAINALPEPLRAYIHRIQTSHPSYDNAVRIRQLEAQVEQLQAALGEEWQPIESAPRDRHVFGWGAKVGRHACYHNGNQWQKTELSSSYLLGPKAITHWRLLPPPPAIDAMAAGEDA